MASDTESANASDTSERTRVPEEPAGNLVEDTIFGGVTFNNSPIQQIRSGRNYLTSSMGSNTAAAREKELTNLSAGNFAGTIAHAFVQAQRIEEERRVASASESTPKSPTNSYGQQLGVTGIELNSGLEVLHVPRNSKQRLAAGVTFKHSRGDTEAARLKRKKTVCVALENKLACNNVLSILNSSDLETHNLATGCQQWQAGISGLIDVLTEHDMLAPFMVPAEFEIDDPTKLAGPFTNILVDFHKVSDGKIQLWQQYIHTHAAPVELESDKWAVAIMMKSMTSELKTLVNDDLHDTDQSKTGTVTMFKLISNHMVLRNQETIDSLHE